METLIEAGFPEAFANELVSRLSESAASQEASTASDKDELLSLLHITDSSRVIASSTVEPFQRLWILSHTPVTSMLPSKHKRDRIKAHRLALGSKHQPLYYKDIPLLNCIRHSYAMANCCSLGLLGEEESVGFTLFWVTGSVAKGDEMLCNWLHPMRKGSPRFSAMCLAMCGHWDGENQTCIANEEERVEHEDIVAKARKSQCGGGRKEEEPLAEEAVISFDVKSSMKVFSDLTIVTDSLPVEGGGVQFVRCEEKGEADIWHIAQHVRGFKDLPKQVFINQFPYEGGIVRKDLLGQSIRKYCCKGSYVPSWFLPSFDLSTEFPQLLNHSKMRKGSLWVVKPAMGTRGAAIEVTDSIAAIVESGCAPGGDRIAQLYLPDPLLLVREGSERGRKFDCRTYVFVRGLGGDEEDPEVFVHNWYYARVAMKEFELTSSRLNDKDIHQTVRKYDGDCDGVQEDSILPREVLLGSEFSRYGKSHDISASSWVKVEERVVEMIKELFDGIRELVLPWSRSRAVYGLDWATCYQDGEILPKLIEVNYCPDLSSIETLYDIDVFLMDMFTCLYAPSVGQGNWTAVYPISGKTS